MFFWAEYQPNGHPPISCTDKPITSEVQIDGTTAADYSPPRRLSVQEIFQVVDDFRVAARNAREAGNFVTLFGFQYHKLFFLNLKFDNLTTSSNFNIISY